MASKQVIEKEIADLESEITTHQAAIIAHAKAQGHTGDLDIRQVRQLIADDEDGERLLEDEQHLVLRHVRAMRELEIAQLSVSLTE